MTREDNSLPVAYMMAGVPADNPALYHRLRYVVGDPAVWVEIRQANGQSRRTVLVRDIEVDRVRQHVVADEVAAPRDYAPAGGLVSDRETATAQAAAEFLRRHEIRQVIADRTLALSYLHELNLAGIQVQYDATFGVRERRAKDAQELAWLAASQRVTEGAVRMACERIAQAEVRDDGVLLAEGNPLTSERVRQEVDVWLLEQGYRGAPAIIAGGPIGADCHDHGSGELHTGEPIIVDIFPQCRATLYFGDCTRTVVHGTIPAEVAKMHAAVVAAKAAGVAAVRVGATGDAVHRATTDAIRAAGYALGLPAADAAPDYCAMVHGTGHGVGLQCHEPPLLDVNGPALVEGDVLTIEPGLYCRAIGGIRVEDMVAVTPGGCVNFNHLPEGLTWK